MCEVDVAAIDDGFFGRARRLAGISTARRCAKGYERGAGPETPARPDPGGRVRSAIVYGQNPDGINLDKVKGPPRTAIDLRPPTSRISADVAADRADKKVVPGAPVHHPPTFPAPGRRASTRPADDLVLISRRHLRSNNSWMHNRARCSLQGQGPLHAARFIPRDAGAVRTTRRRTTPR